MQIKSIVAGAAIALIAGVGSVSADAFHVADTAGDTGTPFAMLDGIATLQMSVQEMAATRGAAVLRPAEFHLDDRYVSSSTSEQNTETITLNYGSVNWDYPRRASGS